MKGLCVPFHPLHVIMRFLPHAPFFFSFAFLTNDLFMDQWRLWMPATSAFLASRACPMNKNEGATLPQRPPAWVFPYVWTVLYVLLGYAWHHAREDVVLDRMHGVCTVLLCAWIVAYACLGRKKTGVYLIASTIATVVSIMSMASTKTSSLALSPLLAWLLVAFQLNWHVVEE